MKNSSSFILLLKKVIKWILILFLAMIAVFLFFLQRDLNRAQEYVKNATAVPPSANNNSIRDHLEVALRVLYPEESPHWTYLGYLISHGGDFKSEYLNTITTRVLFFNDRLYQHEHPSLRGNRLSEIDYHVHNLSRSEKISYLLNSDARWPTNWKDVVLKYCGGSTCECVYGLLKSSDDSLEESELVKKTDAEIDKYLGLNQSSDYRNDLMSCRQRYIQSLKRKLKEGDEVYK